MFRKILFRISFGFSRYYLMLLYKTFWNLYKTKYFLYKNRRKFHHVFSEFSGSFYADCGFFAFCSWLFRWKNPFFLTRPSVNDRIYSYRPYIFHAFFGWFDKFFSFFSRAFLRFSVRLQKNLLLFFIRIIRFLRFFRFVGIIFPAFFRAELRNFSSHSRIFCASPEFFQKKNPLFGGSITQFRTCFSLPSE